jgi:hypothetical protein
VVELPADVGGGIGSAIRTAAYATNARL